MVDGAQNAPTSASAHRGSAFAGPCALQDDVERGQDPDGAARVVVGDNDELPDAGVQKHTRGLRQGP